MKSTKKIIGSLLLVIVVVGGYLYLDSLLFDGVKPQEVTGQDFKASYFASAETEKQPAVILVGGGAWGDYWGQELAKAGFVGLSLPYCQEEGLPALPEEIPLEYFEKAAGWLSQQPEVDPENILVMGASRNAELALVVASYFPDLVHGAIAYSPSSVSWSNTVLPYNSDQVKPSWTYRSQAVPFIPMEKFQGGEAEMVQPLPYWVSGFSNEAIVHRAAIPVEKVSGPIILFSGIADQVWPSARMADMIEGRAKSSGFKFDLENIQFQNAGHLISGNPNSPSTQRQGTMTINGKQHTFEFGGTEAGDLKAQKKSAAKVLELLTKMRYE
ncbi:MAG: palmitoyl-CoA hydrolase [Flavobacteriales bacterium]|nr:palmitoyl-CoA hydrolase [Flavobacteriales bacterium]